MMPVNRHNVASLLAGPALALALIGGASSAFAIPTGGHTVTPFDGSAFTSACAGLGYGGFGFGEDIGNDLGTFGISDENNNPMACSSGTSNGLTPATASHAYGPANVGNLGGSFSGSAAGSAQAGLIKLQAANDANMIQRFSGAAANGGWNDSYTVGGGSGQGLWVVPIHVSGIMNTPLQGSTAILQIIPYLGNTPIGSVPAHRAAALLQYLALNTPTSANVTHAASIEYSSWGAINYGPNDSLTTTQLIVNETVNLVIPITYNVPVDLGIFASVLTGEQAQSAGTGPSDIQFQNTIAWLGAGYVLDWDAQNGIGAHNNNITVTAASGVDYTQSFLTSVPEPGTIAILCLGLFGLGMAAHRRH